MYFTSYTSIYFAAKEVKRKEKCICISKLQLIQHFPSFQSGIVFLLVIEEGEGEQMFYLQ